MSNSSPKKTFFDFIVVFIQKITIYFFLFFSLLSNSQVGIGTTNPTAALEVNSSNQGFLVPRVSLLNKTNSLPVINPLGGELTESTLVYNIATSGTPPNNVVPGFYYWNGTSWVKFETNNSGSGNFWSLNGNNITDTDFIGTNNYKEFNIKSGGTLLGTFNPGGSIKLGVNSSSSNNNAFAIGFNATSAFSESYSFGSEAWANNWRSLALGSNTKTDGAYSVAMGNFASTGVNGSNSVAIGYYATTNASEACAIGTSANASGDNSIAIGNNSISSSSQTLALGSNASATNSGATAIGLGSNSSGLYSTAIGYNASTSKNNAIVLGDSSSSIANVGIGTSNPDSKLHIVSTTPTGGFQLQDGNQGVGKILISDVNGKGTWKNLLDDQSIGEITKNTNSPLSIGQISLGSSNVNINVSNGSDYIQVTKNGLYKVTYHTNLQKNSVTGIVNGYIYLTNWGAEWPNTRSYFSLNSSESLSVTITKYIYLNAWQSISLYSSIANSDVTVLSNGTYIALELLR